MPADIILMIFKCVDGKSILKCGSIEKDAEAESIPCRFRRKTPLSIRYGGVLPAIFGT